MNDSDPKKLRIRITTREGDPLNLSYTDVGSGPPLVLLGGLGMENRGWAWQIKAFSGSFRVIALEHRGSGTSETPPGPYTITQLADDLLSFLKELNLSRIHLLGLSMGGMVALQFAADHPERVAGLILAQTGFSSPPRTAFLLRSWQILSEEKGASREIFFRSQLPWLLPERFFADSRGIETLISQHLQLSQEQNPAGFGFQVAACCSFAGESLGKKITGRTLVLGSRDDLMFPEWKLRELAGGIPGAQLQLLESGGHLGFALENQKFNRSVLDFLAENHPTTL